MLKFLNKDIQEQTGASLIEKVYKLISFKVNDADKLPLITISCVEFMGGPIKRFYLRNKNKELGDISVELDLCDSKKRFILKDAKFKSCKEVIGEEGAGIVSMKMEINAKQLKVIKE